MAECEICGKNVNSVKKAEIDGVLLEVCEECAKLGKEVLQPKPVVLKKAVVLPQIEEGKELVDDFAQKIRRAREEKGLTQDEAADKIGISRLVYKRIENGLKPDEKIARKIEKFFGIKLYTSI
jgi:putative transcription factor